MTEQRLHPLLPTANRPHLVLLGAGASRAALPNGDKHGRRVPLMSEIVECVGLEPILRRARIPFQEGSDFEGLFSRLALSRENGACIVRLERAICDYFTSLELPDGPTLYDHLVLSLRPKDVIATFNWDPFLWQALQRNRKFAPMPRILFLHGNVVIGFCLRHDKPDMGSWRSPCRICGGRKTRSRLLYPVTQKNYGRDPQIALMWHELRAQLQNAYLITVFGHSGPATDREVIELLQQRWATSERGVEEVEILNTARPRVLHQSWRPFIPGGQYRIRRSFSESLIARFPRRSCEAFKSAAIEYAPQPPQVIPWEADWPALRDWYQPMLEQEKHAESKAGSSSTPITSHRTRRARAAPRANPPAPFPAFG